MKRKELSLLRVLVFTSIFLFSPVYLDYGDLIEDDFLSSEMGFEDRDIEVVSIDKQLNFTIRSNHLPIFPLRGNSLFYSPTEFSLQTPSPCQKPFTLRC